MTEATKRDLKIQVRMACQVPEFRRVRRYIESEVRTGSDPSQAIECAISEFRKVLVEASGELYEKKP
jgi:hypothetical protein